MDFSNAFAQADLDEDVYCELPKGFLPPEDGDYVLKLRKSLYGLRQSSMSWFNYLKAGLERRGFKSSKLDPCLFIHKDMICLVYVDDCLFFARDEAKIISMLEQLKRDHFNFTVEQTVEQFLGIKIDVDKDEMV